MSAMQETRAWSLGREDPLKKGMATHSGILSCLENPMNRGAWRATVTGISKSQTQLSDWHLNLFTPGRDDIANCWKTLVTLESKLLIYIKIALSLKINLRIFEVMMQKSYILAQKDYDLKSCLMSYLEDLTEITSWTEE